MFGLVCNHTSAVVWVSHFKAVARGFLVEGRDRETERWGALSEEKDQEGGFRLLEKHGKCFTGVLAFNGQTKINIFKNIVIFYNFKKYIYSGYKLFYKNFYNLLM